MTDVFVFDPPAFVAFKDTVYVPAAAYECTGLWTVALTNEPSPNDQFQEVGVPVDKSLNVTFNGAVPEVGVPVKALTGTAT